MDNVYCVQLMRLNTVTEQFLGNHPCGWISTLVSYSSMNWTYCTALDVVVVQCR